MRQDFITSAALWEIAGRSGTISFAMISATSSGVRMSPWGAWPTVGSPSIDGQRERKAEESINFVACHDGFSLNDVLAYNHKHNEENGHKFGVSITAAATANE